jgi:hypothetical protein
MTASDDDREIEYDDETDTYWLSYDVNGEKPGVRLLEAVASIKDADPTELDPLDQYVDADALNAIFRPTQGMPDAHGSLSITYEGLLIVVHSDGKIELREQSQPS